MPQSLENTEDPRFDVHIQRRKLRVPIARRTPLNDLNGRFLLRLLPTTQTCNWHFTVSYNTSNRQNHQARWKLLWSQPSRGTPAIPHLPAFYSQLPNVQGKKNMKYIYWKSVIKVKKAVPQVLLRNSSTQRRKVWLSDTRTNCVKVFWHRNLELVLEGRAKTFRF